MDRVSIIVTSSPTIQPINSSNFLRSTYTITYIHVLTFHLAQFLVRSLLSPVLQNHSGTSFPSPLSNPLPFSCVHHSSSAPVSSSLSRGKGSEPNASHHRTTTITTTIASTSHHYSRAHQPPPFSPHPLLSLNQNLHRPVATPPYKTLVPQILSLLHRPFSSLVRKSSSPNPPSQPSIHSPPSQVPLRSMLRLFVHRR